MHIPTRILSFNCLRISKYAEVKLYNMCVSEPIKWHFKPDFKLRRKKLYLRNDFMSEASNQNERDVWVEGLTRLIESMKNASYQLQVERSVNSIMYLIDSVTESAQVHYVQVTLTDTLYILECNVNGLI